MIIEVQKGDVIKEINLINTISGKWQYSLNINDNLYKLEEIDITKMKVIFKDISKYIEDNSKGFKIEL